MSNRLPSLRHHLALAVPTSYRRWTRITFTRGGVSRVYEPTAGSFTQDARRKGRWSGSLSFVGANLMPKRPSDILTPFGTRVGVELGIELLDGSRSSVSYGQYVVTSSSTSTTANDRTTEVSLVDLSDIPDRYRFEAPLTIASNTDLAAMVNAVITSRTGVNPAVANTGSTLGAARTFGLDPETGPWDEIEDVLNGFSRQAWYDRSGQIAIGATNPDPNSAYTLPGLTSISADFDTRPYNVVVARGEPQDGSAPVQAIAMDDNPSSPTYAGTGPGTSPYGRVTRFYASPLIETVGQAQSAAETLLKSYIGEGAMYSLVRPFDPTIDAGDVVAVDGKILVVDSVTLNITGETSIQARELA